jgi:hypothetical protein
MSRNLLLATVAATALIAGGSIASAQGMSQKSDAPKASEQMKSDAPKAQDAQKSESAPKAKQDAQKSESAPKAKSQTTGQAPREGQGGGMQRQEGQSGQGGQTGQDRQGQGQMGQERQERRDGQREGQSEQRRDGQGQQRQEGQRQDNQRQDGQRQGQNERSNTQLTSEQRTKISSVVKTHSEARVTNVNFAVSVGTVVPRTVKLVALPEEVIVIHPAWRGFRFFIVNEQIVVVEPDTLRIVAVIPA